MLLLTSEIQLSAREVDSTFGVTDDTAFNCADSAQLIVSLALLDVSTNLGDALTAAATGIVDGDGDDGSEEEEEEDAAVVVAGAT